MSRVFLRGFFIYEFLLHFDLSIFSFMVILENINVNFGTRKLFDSVNLRVGGKDKIGRAHV